MLIRNVEFTEQFNFESVKFPVHKIDYSKIKKQNLVSISVLGYENHTPHQIYTPKQTFKRRVILLLL